MPVEFWQKGKLISVVEDEPVRAVEIGEARANLASVI